MSLRYLINIHATTWVAHEYQFVRCYAIGISDFGKVMSNHNNIQDPAVAHSILDQIGQLQHSIHQMERDLHEVQQSRGATSHSHPSHPTSLSPPHYRYGEARGPTSGNYSRAEYFDDVADTPTDQVTL